MRNTVLFLSLFVAFGFHSCSSAQESKEPWSEDQLMEPKALAELLNNPEAKVPVLYSVGPAGLIYNSIDIGEGQNPDNIAKLRKKLHDLPKDTDIVIYCGCCPFKDCPNIRPTFNLLNEMGFTKHKLLNLPQNLKVDWIDKDYPMIDE